MPTSTVRRPADSSAAASTVEVVRLPIAPSVPRTAIRGHVTESIEPENMCRSFLSAGRRTSRISTPPRIAAAANSGSSLRNSCRPLTTLMPRDMARSTTARWSAESSPLDGAMPNTNQSGRPPDAPGTASSPATTGMPFGPSPRTCPASAPACVLSITATIRNRSECRTRPLAVLPSVRPKFPSQYTTAVGRAGGGVSPGARATRRDVDDGDMVLLESGLRGGDRIETAPGAVRQGEVPAKSYRCSHPTRWGVFPPVGDGRRRRRSVRHAGAV